MSSAVVWFRNDLRLDDNPAWNEATRSHSAVTALFVIDPTLWDPAPPGRRTRLEAHLGALDERLTDGGGRLYVRRADPRRVVAEVAAGRPVYWNRDVSPVARRRDEAVAALVDARVFDGRYVVPVGSVLTTSGEPYRVFSPFFRRWREAARPPWPRPGSATIADDPGEGLEGRVATDDAGEAGAAQRLHRFLPVVGDYPDSRDFPARRATSRLSEDLRFGTISPRQIEEMVGYDSPGGTAFLRQLAWREFCAQLLWAYPDLRITELRPEFRGLSWRDDPGAAEAWKAGQTGYPIIDAGMRELAATGWMHNRVRMLTASFLVKDLLVDWRVGERHFAALLHDYDPAQNATNWQWVAGTGADAAPYFRVFNPVTQGRRFDPTGDYVRRWVPQLARIEGDLHAPWESSADSLAAAGVVLGETYPLPMVDHATARREAIEFYEAGRA